MAITNPSGSTIRPDSGRTNSTATSGGTGVLNDTGQSWTTNAEAGFVVWIYAGTGAGQRALIASNTATQLTIRRSWSPNFTTGVLNVGVNDWVVQPDNTSQYVIMYRWADLQAANDSGGWGIMTTNGNQIRVNGDILFGAGTNFGGVYDYGKTIEIFWPSASGYQVDRMLMSDNAMWGMGLPDDNGEPIEPCFYHFDASNLNTTGVDLINGAFTGSNYNCYIDKFDSILTATTYSTPQSWIFLRMKSNSEVINKSLKSLGGPAGRWSSNNTIVDGATFHDCINDWALTGSPTAPLKGVVVYNAGAGAQISDPGAQYEKWQYYNNNKVFSMGGFTSGNTFRAIDCLYDKDGTVGLLSASDFTCSSSLAGAGLAGDFYNSKKVSFNIVDESEVAINGARIYLENTNGTQLVNETSDSNGDSTETTIDVQLFNGSSNPGVNNVDAAAPTNYNPMLLLLWDYGKVLFSEPFTLEFNITAARKQLKNDPFTVANEATAATYSSKFTINHVAGTVTVAADATIQELWDYQTYDGIQSGNISYFTNGKWLTTADGVNFTSTYDITVTGSGVQFAEEGKTISFTGGAALTVASGAFYEDDNGAIWESGGSNYYATHFRLRALISGTSTAIQGAVIAYLSSGTNYTYNTSLSNTTLTTDASGDVEGYAVYQIDATPVSSLVLNAREYDYDFFTSPANLDGTPIGSSGSPISIAMVADSFVTASRATAAAYTGITITHGGTDTLAVATTNRTIEQVYDYNKYNITLAANIAESAWFTTNDGVNFTITYDTTVTGVDLANEADSITFSGSTLTVASGGFFEDSNGARWENGGSVYYATHFRNRFLISGTSTAIQGVVMSYFETDTNTNVTYNTSLSNGVLTSDASGDVEGYAVYRVNAATYGGHNLVAREYDYDLYSAPASLDGTPIGDSTTPINVSLVTDSLVSASRATALAYNYTVNHGSTLVTADTADTTIQEMYDYSKYDISLSANITQSQWLTSNDGTNFTTTYDLTVDGVDMQEEAKNLTFSSATLTVSNAGFFEDGLKVRWENAASVYYASHIRFEMNIDGTTTSIQNGVFAAYETDTDTNVTYDTSLTAGGLTSDVNGQVEGYVVYRVDSTTYGGHNLVVAHYNYLYSVIPINPSGAPLGAAGAYTLYFLRTDANVTDTRANALLVSGVTVNYSGQTVTTSATASDTYDNLKARQTRTANIDTGVSGIDSYYAVYQYNNTEGLILAHTGSAHSLSDQWDLSIASDYGYPLEFDSSTLSLTATGTYDNITLTDNSTVEFEVAGTYNLSTGLTNTASTTFDNLTASAVTVSVAPTATLPTLANTGGGGNPIIDNSVSITIDDQAGTSLVDGTRVRVVNVTVQSLSAWQATTAYSVGDRVLRTTGLGTELNGGVYFWCTTAGTSGGTEPTWDVAASGNTTSDGTVTWTVRPVEIDNSLVSGGSGYSVTLTSNTDYAIGDSMRLDHRYQSGTSAYARESVTFVAQAADQSILATQVADSVYNQNGTDYSLDGSAVIGLAADFPNIEIDVTSTGTVYTEDIYAWVVYEETTANGIRNFFGSITAEDVGNYRINTSVVNLHLDNQSSGSVIHTSRRTNPARLYRDDNSSIWSNVGANSDHGRVLLEGYADNLTTKKYIALKQAL